MARSKIDQMRSMVRRAEKAEAKLTKREMENIENGRKAREVLAIIKKRIDNINDTIAEAYAVVPSEKVDSILTRTVEELRSLIEENTVDEVTVSRPKRERKVAESEVKAASAASEITEPVSVNYLYGDQQNVAYQAGGIQYVAQ